MIPENSSAPFCVPDTCLHHSTWHIFPFCCQPNLCFLAIKLFLLLFNNSCIVFLFSLCSSNFSPLLFIPYFLTSVLTTAGLVVLTDVFDYRWHVLVFYRLYIGMTPTERIYQMIVNATKRRKSTLLNLIPELAIVSIHH